MTAISPHITETQIKNNKIFGVLLLLTQIVLIFMFGFFIAYAQSRAVSDDYFIIGALIILALCGFGLLSTYVKSVSSASLTHIIIILGLSIQLYFPFRGFWQIIGLSGAKWSTRNDDDILPVSISNVLNDRQSSQMLQSSPLTDYIACLISLIVGYSAVIGRVGNLQVYFFTVIGTFIYEFNAMIFWRIMVTDCGFGMRIFLYGGCLGLFASLILAKKQSTFAHINYQSQYYFQGINLFASIIIWCLLPVLVWSDLYHSSTVGKDSYVLNIASFNTWFALFGSAIGSFCGCIIVYKKLSVHTIVFSIFAGGIGYLSSADVNMNVGAALAVGAGTGLLSAIGTSLAKIRMNHKGVIDSNGVVSSYLFPGFISALLSAIFQASGFTNINDYTAIYRGNTITQRNAYGQGAIQIAGLGIAAGCGIFAGVVSGLMMKIGNRGRGREEQFLGDGVVMQRVVGVRADGQGREGREGEQIVQI